MPYHTVLAKVLLYAAFVMLSCVPSVPSLFRAFYYEEVWDFVGFFCTYRNEHVTSVPKCYLCAV